MWMWKYSVHWLKSPLGIYRGAVWLGLMLVLFPFFEEAAHWSPQLLHKFPWKLRLWNTFSSFIGHLYFCDYPPPHVSILCICGHTYGDPRVTYGSWFSPPCESWGKASLVGSTLTHCSVLFLFFSVHYLVCDWMIWGEGWLICVVLYISWKYINYIYIFN